MAQLCGSRASFVPGTVDASCRRSQIRNPDDPTGSINGTPRSSRKSLRNLVLEAAYVGNEDIFWTPAAGFRDFNRDSPALLQQYGRHHRWFGPRHQR